MNGANDMTDFKHGVCKKVKDHKCLIKSGDPINFGSHLGNKWFGKCSICGRKIRGKIVPDVNEDFKPYPPEDL